MNLEMQIQSLMFSLFFGMFYALVYNLFYKVLFNEKKTIRLFVNLIFQLSLFILYFIFLKVINSGIIHWYFLLMLWSGFLIGNMKIRKIRKPS